MSSSWTQTVELMSEEDLVIECFTHNLPLWGTKAILRRRLLRFIQEKSGQGTSGTHTESDSPRFESGSEEDISDSKMVNVDEALVNPDVEDFAVSNSSEDDEDVEEEIVISSNDSAIANMEDGLLIPVEAVAGTSNDDSNVEGYVVEQIKDPLVEYYNNHDEMPNEVMFNMPKDYLN